MMKRTFTALAGLLAATGCTLAAPSPTNSVVTERMTPETVHVLLEATTTGSHKARVVYRAGIGGPSIAKAATFRDSWSYEFDIQRPDSVDALSRTIVEVTALTDSSKVTVTCSVTIDGLLGDHRRQTGKRAYTNCIGSED